MQPDHQLATLIAVLEDHRIALYITAAATTLTALAAIFALVFAVRQIREAQAATRAARDATKANFLMGLDRRWEAPEMKKSRDKFRDIKAKVDELLLKNRNEPDQEKKRQGEFSQMLIDDPAGYSDFISIVGFFETVGYIVDNNYMGAQDILDILVSLYEMSIVTAGIISRQISQVAPRPPSYGSTPAT